MHLSTDFCEQPDGFWEPKCECGWHGGHVPDAETAVDFLMQHAREMALIEDVEDEK